VGTAALYPDQKPCGRRGRYSGPLGVAAALKLW
jgi:hypothetical protein